PSDAVEIGFRPRKRIELPDQFGQFHPESINLFQALEVNIRDEGPDAVPAFHQPLRLQPAQDAPDRRAADLELEASSSSDSRKPGSYSSRQIRSRIVLYMCSNRCRALLPAGLFRSDLSSIAFVPGPRGTLLMRLQHGAEEGAGALVL